MNQKTDSLLTKASSRLYLKEPLTDRFLLIDGISRTGKMLMGKLLSSLSGVENFQPYDPIEHIIGFAKTGVMGRDNVKSFLRLHFDIAIYNHVIGRNLNSRSTDSSSINLALDADAYHRRAAEADTNVLLDTFIASKRWPLFMTHESLLYADLFFDAAPNMRFVEMVRHPADLAYSCWQRGWGDRRGVDPLSFSVAMDHNGGPVPPFAVTWADDYLAMQPVDRVIHAIARLRQATDDTINGLPQGQRDAIAFVPYENMLRDPNSTMQKLAEFIGTTTMPGIETVYAREGLPATKMQSSVIERLDIIKQQADPASLKILEAEAAIYTERYGIDPLV